MLPRPASRRRAAALRALALAALAARALAEGSAAASDAALLHTPFAPVPIQSLVLRANRAAYTRQLEPEFVCTSLSGPACPSGLAEWGATFSRTAPEVAPELLPAAWLQGEGSVFAQVRDAPSFHSLLTAGGEWLVLFYDARCGAPCADAAAAIRGAAPRLAASRVRFLAVSCEAGSPTGRVCAQHLVQALPEARLYFGSPHVSLRLEQVTFAAKRKAHGDDHDDQEDDDDDDDDDEDELAAGLLADDAGNARWTADGVVSFFERSTTPEVRAMLAHARQLLLASAAGDEQPDAVGVDAGGEAAVAAEGERGAAVAAEGDDVSATLMSSLARLIAQNGADAAAEEAAGAPGEVAELFRVQLQALLQAAGAAAGAAEAEALLAAAPAPSAAGAADDPLLGGPAPRSLPSKTQRLVQFVNSRASAVDVHWLDFAGRERRYARVEPGRAATLASFTSHVWRVRDARPASNPLLATVAVRGRAAGEPDVQRIVIL